MAGKVFALLLPLLAIGLLQVPAIRESQRAFTVVTDIPSQWHFFNPVLSSSLTNDRISWHGNGHREPPNDGHSWQVYIQPEEDDEV
jgi:hypothetical protein